MIDFNRLHIDIGWVEMFANYEEAVKGIATWLDGSSITNPPDKAKRWNAENRRPEIYDILAATWGPLLDINDDTKPYEIRVAQANYADAAFYAEEAASADHASAADSATNALNFGGLPPDDYRKLSDIIPTTNGGTGASTVEGALSNLGIKNSALYPIGTGLNQIPFANYLGSLAWKSSLAVTASFTTQSSSVSGTGTAGQVLTVTANAPSGYQFCAFVSAELSTSSPMTAYARPILSSVNSAGTVVTLVDESVIAGSYYTGTAKIIWKKVTVS